MKVEQCNFPDDIEYDVERNVWVRRENGRARIGANAILVWVSGAITSVTLKPIGTRLSIGQSLGSLEGPRHFDVLRAPLSGFVAETNGILLEEPRILTKEPYGTGWMVVMRPTDHDEITQLVRLPEASDALARRVKELRVHCFAEFPDSEMFEVGVECSAVLVRLNEFLGSSNRGTVVHIVSDDTSAEIEMTRWSEQTGNQILEWRREGNLYHFLVKKTK